MDRLAARARLLIPAALLLCAAADQPDVPIRDARWTRAPNLVADLTRQPAECVKLPREMEQRRSVAIGRAAFRSPLLLGGQAARAGVSCASCHRNGRGNPHFHFPGLSGEPGTADVTASLMSKLRGDGAFNPKPIPDLAGNSPKVSRDPTRDDLRRFIRGLIVEEFDGPEPPPAVLGGVTAYVRALAASNCPAAPDVAVTLWEMLSDTEAAVTAARTAGDPATERVMLAAARATLGTIDERMAVPGLEAARGVLKLADADLRALQGAPSPKLYRGWDRRWPGRKRRLRAVEHRSLFSPAVLRPLLER